MQGSREVEQKPVRITLIENMAGNVTDIAFAPDGRTLAFRGPNGEVVLFQWPSGETVGKLSGDAALGSRLVFSSDGRRLATAVSTDSSVLLWDVASLVNRPLPEIAKPSAADLRGWWADLRDDSPGSAYKAVWRFAAAPEQALPFLSDSLRPAKGPEPAAVARWITDLGSEKFEVRDRASRELEQLGKAVVDALQKAKADWLGCRRVGVRRFQRMRSSISGKQMTADVRF